jgi:sugar phosphate isomerase/epimerase
MKLLFSTGSLYHLPIEKIFEVARQAGFDGCELVAGPNLGDDAYLDRVFRCAETFPVLSIHAPYMRIPAWGDDVEALRRTVTLGQELGAAVVNFHPPSWFSLELQFLRWFRRVHDFQETLSCGSLALTIENMPRMGRKLMLAPFILNEIQDLIQFGIAKNLYFTFDTTHCASFHGDVVAGFLRYLATGRLKNVHLSDYGDAREHLFLGRGEVPVVRLLNAMRRLEYNGLLTLELAPQEWPKNEEWLVKLMGYSVSFLKLHLGMA